MRITGAGENIPDGFRSRGGKGKERSGSRPVEDADRAIGEGDENARVVACDDDYVGSATLKRNCGGWVEGKRAIG